MFLHLIDSLATVSFSYSRGLEFSQCVVGVCLSFLPKSSQVNHLRYFEVQQVVPGIKVGRVRLVVGLGDKRGSFVQKIVPVNI
jgi:hypothetical protein